MNNTTATSQTYAIGGELTVNRLGYGAMRLSGQPGNFAMRPRVDVRRKGTRIEHILIGKEEKNFYAVLSNWE